MASSCPLPPVKSLKETIEKQMNDYLSAVQTWVREQELLIQKRHDALDRKEQELWKQQEELASARASFEAEAAAVRKLAEPSEVIEFNVGGTLLSARRSTLCGYDSMLSSMFSGRWNNDNFGRDAAGRIYLELNGECFQVVLEWLRARVIDPKAPVPSAPEGKESIFDAMCEFLQLEEICVNPRSRLDKNDAAVVQVSSQGSALGSRPSEIFNNDPETGWTSENNQRDSWIICDLRRKCRISKADLTFESNYFESRVPTTAILCSASSADGPWYEVTHFQISASTASASGFRCQAQYLKLTFSFEEAASRQYVALVQFQLS